MQLSALQFCASEHMDFHFFNVHFFVWLQDRRLARPNMERRIRWVVKQLHGDVNYQIGDRNMNPKHCFVTTGTQLESYSELQYL